MGPFALSELANFLHLISVGKDRVVGTPGGCEFERNWICIDDDHGGRHHGF
ncbi:unannotated protein [freshwater metagenome]|uniref:Unannotated protein n=1 Tax=freshwater metagenome TaxID=449393 RepID=A0A6J7SZG1_9ZZZZ